MEKEIRILHLEDDLNDAELIRRALEQGGLNLSIVHVATEAKFLERLGDGNWSLILSDKELPSFDGFAALTIVRGRRLTTPFILVTGTTDAATIIEAFRKGATDCVLKHQMAETLLPAVARALEKAKEALRRELLAICSYCKNVRPETSWMLIEQHFSQRNQVDFSHTICPVCYAKHIQPELNALKLQLPKE